MSGFLRQNLSNSINMSFLSNWNKNTSHSSRQIIDEMSR